MPIITDKGHVVGLEAFLVFLAWMLVVSVVWSQSSNEVHSSLDAWKMIRARETSIALSDALILSHHVDAWKGCAVFDETLHRSRAYVVEESCFQKISHVPSPSSHIARVSLRRDSFNINYFSRDVNENETCVSLRRPVFLFPEMKSALVDVMSCA